MEWFKCPVCIYRHPFEVADDKPCPNLDLVSDRSRQIFNQENVLYMPLGPHQMVPESSQAPVAREET